MFLLKKCMAELPTHCWQQGSRILNVWITLIHPELIQSGWQDIKIQELNQTDARFSDLDLVPRPRVCVETRTEEGTVEPLVTWQCPQF